MRKAQKEQVKGFAELLGQAHSQIKKALEDGNSGQAMELLGQCQDGTIQLGNIIEEAEGENFVTIPILEEYCELVYQFYNKLQQGISENGDWLCLEEALQRIKNSIENDIRVRIEAVFLPYKAAMWDSLESVWRAADEDPDCDAYVIPIPYFDKNSDGTVKEMHYEGDLYPDDVPVTKYDAFDFGQHRPDMIFIHNPYDDCNFVTSVHPFFYTKNLKKYTDKLIYIPYFVLDEPNPDDERALGNLEHFCKIPGVLNSDKVIVQSENMRQVYIKILTRITGEHTKVYWEDRVLGLGSPKIDKALSVSGDSVSIPEQWKRVIEKKDGSRKKVILYNTTVNVLVNEGEKMLEKMRFVFRVFKERQEDTALLWRPHPLIQATIEAMEPQLWSEYQILVEQYRAEGWGIYDDSADLNRAIALCDAYYGDGSSLVQLCQKAGKPVMIQNIEILE